MDIDTVINRISFILAIAGALFSWWQACRAKKIKDEIKADRIKTALIDLMTKAESARTSSQKLAPLISGKQSRGFDLTEYLRIIQQFIERLNDNMHLFTSDALFNSFSELKKDFDKYKNESDTARKSKEGQNLYNTLNLIIAELHKYNDGLSY